MYQLTSNDIPGALKAKELIEAMEHAESSREIIAEGFLYKHTSLLISSEPGCGKSTISTQIAVELASGLPLFGYFHVPKPVKVFYVQCERNIIELLERLKVISKTLSINFNNLVITDQYQRLDFSRHAPVLLECIKRDCPDAEVIIFDPIYATLAGGLKDDRPASIFTKIMSAISKSIGAAHILNHHTVKQTYSSFGEKIERDDPFYGSQWLKAHVTGSYTMKKTDKGVHLINKKDNYDILTKDILLDFNGETELSYLADFAELAPIDRLKHFLRNKKLKNSTFIFSDIKRETKLCTRTIRQLLMHNTIRGVLEIEKGLKNKHFYRVKDIQF